MSIDAIKQRIKEAGGPKDKIAELNLSGIKIRQFTKDTTALLESCKSLEILILSDCELESLEGLPKTELEGIDLSNNK